MPKALVAAACGLIVLLAPLSADALPHVGLDLANAVPSFTVEEFQPDGEPCLAARPDLPIPLPLDGAADFDAAALVYEGGVTDARVSSGLLAEVSVSPGSARYLAGRGKPSFIWTAESSSPGEFKGLPAARQLVEQGWVVKGFTLSKGAVKHILVGEHETAVMGPGEAVPFQDDGAEESGAGSRPYVRARWEGGKVVVRGQRFRPFWPVWLVVDGTRQPKPARPDADGNFKSALPAPPGPGSYAFWAVQMTPKRTIAYDGGTLFVPTGDLDEDRVTEK